MQYKYLVVRYDVNIRRTEVSVYNVIFMEIVHSRRHLRQERYYITNLTSLFENVIL